MELKPNIFFGYIALLNFTSLIVDFIGMLRTRKRVCLTEFLRKMSQQFNEDQSDIMRTCDIIESNEWGHILIKLCSPGQEAALKTYCKIFTLTDKEWGKRFGNLDPEKTHGIFESNPKKVFFTRILPRFAAQMVNRNKQIPLILSLLFEAIKMKSHKVDESYIELEGYDNCDRQTVVTHW